MAVDIEFPSMVQATQPVLFVAPEKERSATMRANVIDQSDLPIGVAEGHEIFAQEPHAQRCAIRVRQVGGLECGNPVLTEEIAHGRAGANTGQEVVF